MTLLTISRQENIYTVPSQNGGKGLRVQIVNALCIGSNVQLQSSHSGQLSKKKMRTLLHCLQVEFLNIWVGWADFFFLINLLSTHEYTIWVHFPPFFSLSLSFSFFLFFFKKVKMLGPFPILILFLEMGRSLRATTFFSS